VLNHLLRNASLENFNSLNPQIQCPLPSLAPIPSNRCHLPGWHQVLVSGNRPLAQHLQTFSVFQILGPFITLYSCPSPQLHALGFPIFWILDILLSFKSQFPNSSRLLPPPRPARSDSGDTRTPKPPAKPVDLSVLQPAPPSLSNVRHYRLRIPRCGGRGPTSWPLSPPPESRMFPPQDAPASGAGFPLQLAEPGCCVAQARTTCHSTTPKGHLILHAGLLRRRPRAQPPPRRDLGCCTTSRNGC
jgi:hypothetical protein